MATEDRSSADDMPEGAQAPLRAEMEEHASTESLVIEFGRILDGSMNEIYIFDAITLRFVHANEGARRNLGYTMDELRERTPLDLKPEFTPERYVELIRPLREGDRQTIEFDTIHRRKDGSSYPVYVRLQRSTLQDREVFVAIILDVTERRLVEEARRRGEALLRTIIDSSKDAIIAIDEQGRITLFNPAAAAMFGIEAEAMVGQGLHRLMPEEYRDHHQEYVSGYFATGKPDVAIGNTVELLAVRSDGTQFPIELSLSVGQVGETRLALAVIRDISERREIEKALSERDASLTQAAALADIGYWTWQAATGDLRCSDELLRLLGEAEPGAMRPRSLLDYVHPEDRTDVLLGIDAALYERKPYAQEFRVVRSDGQIAHVQSLAQVTRDDAGRPSQLLGVLQDITVRKLSAMALDQSRGELEQLVRSIPTGIILVDRETRTIEDANDTAVRMFGAPREAIIGQVCHKFVCPAERGACPVCDLGQTVDASERVLIASDRSQCPILKSVVPITLEGRALLLESFVDITAQKEAQAVLERLSTRDALTGLPNRRAFEEYLELEWRRAARAGVPISVLLCDIDRFKSYNDTHGHLAGDGCLKSVAGLLQATCQRAGDLVARWGGEEFAVVCPGQDAEGAHSFAERLRQTVEAAGLPRGDVPEGIVTMSVGVATDQAARGRSPEALLAAADAAMYESKRAGRNRVTVARAPAR